MEDARRENDPTVRFGFAAVLVAHGAIHVGVFLRAFELVDAYGQKDPIGRATGVAWMVVGAASLGTALMFLAGSARWRLLAGFTAVASQILIFARFSEVGFGTLGNVLILLAMVFLR